MKLVLVQVIKCCSWTSHTFILFSFDIWCWTVNR